MIILITGENWYVRDQAIKQIVGQFSGAPERFDGSELNVHDLPGLLGGATLFASERLVIIKDAASNSLVWEKLPDWFDNISDETQVVLVEAKLDKRTRTAKELLKKAKVIEATMLSARERPKALNWLEQESGTRGVRLSNQQKNMLIERALVPGKRPGHYDIDSGLLAQTLDKLSVFENLTDERIVDVLPATENENIFELFEAVLAGKANRVDEICRVLEQTEASQMVLGLLVGQLNQFAALVLADVPTEQVGKDIGAHPFVLSKLAPYARAMTTARLADMIERFAAADARIKTSSGDDWTVLWQLMMGLAVKQARP